jgi:hypothetical protein
MTWEDDHEFWVGKDLESLFEYITASPGEAE